MAEDRPNVLFIIVDDLRPDLGCYGVTEASTPHIDQLAETSLLFQRAYCQQAVCMASRFSLLTGLRPDERKIYTNRDVRENLQDIDFLPGHFRKHNYHTAGIGKIAHNSWEDPRCWSEPHRMPPNAPWEYRTRAGRELVEQIRSRATEAGQPDPFKNIPEKIRRGMPWEILDLPDSETGDRQIADLTIEELARAGKSEQPFFIAAGFLRPHLPFVAPRSYWDRFDPASLPSPSHKTFPQGAPPPANSGSGELLHQYRGLPPKLPLAPESAKQLVHGYYACVSFIDEQIGRILAGLEANGLDQNTIVVLTSDHGFQLGDHGMWGKATNFELSTRVPLLLRNPGMKSTGKVTTSIVELLDLYPTLCDLAAIPQPDHLQGKSFAPLLDDPESDTGGTAMSQYSRRGLTGYSIRTDKYRYTEWIDRESGTTEYRELYDHRQNSQETRNALNDPDLSGELEKLADTLQKKRSP